MTSDGVQYNRIDKNTIALVLDGVVYGKVCYDEDTKLYTCVSDYGVCKDPFTTLEDAKESLYKFAFHIQYRRIRSTYN